MNKADLVQSVSISNDITKKMAAKIIDTLFEHIATSLQDGGKVAIAGFGSFNVKERAARTGRNPATGKSIEIDAKNVVSFKASKELKERVA